MKLIVADLTPPDVMHLTSEIKVIRTIIPGLIPMYFDTGPEPLGMKRLYSLPKKLGCLGRKLDIKEINKFPHPFP